MPQKEIREEPIPPFPHQRQKSPGLEAKMHPSPKFLAREYKAAGKLTGQSALITGGDSGIGRAVAVLFAREGADVAISFLPEEAGDAETTQRVIHQMGRRCLLLPGDITDEKTCVEIVERTVETLGSLDILVSNAAYQRRKNSLEEITAKEWHKTFRTNIDAYFFLAKAAVKHMRPGSAIIATSSETASLGPKELLDYAATKGAIETFTKSLAKLLVDKGIRVNAVAPGPVWTPLNVSDAGASEEKIEHFGEKQPIGRPAQPEEIAPAYVFLASHADSSYVTGAVIAETGGQPLN